jgi:hypothetical protein
MNMRENVDSARTYYVSPTGNDTNNGLSVGSPFKTTQRAVDEVCDKLIMSAPVTIQHADGSYPVNVNLRPYFSSVLAGDAVTINGNATNNTGVLFNPSSGFTFAAVGVTSPWTLKNLKLENAHGHGILADFGSVIYTRNLNYGAHPEGHHIISEWGSKVEAIQEGYTISGGAISHAYATRNSMILMQGGHAVTLTGIPNFSSCYAFADMGCIVDLATGVTFIGVATGVKSRYDSGGRIILPNQLPGNVDPANGDYVEHIVTAPVSLTANNIVNITSIFVRDGEWDVWGVLKYRGDSADAVNYLAAGIADANNSLSSAIGDTDFLVPSHANQFYWSNTVSVKVGPVRKRIAYSGNFYLNAYAGFQYGDCSVTGNIFARRMQEY